MTIPTLGDGIQIDSFAFYPKGQNRGYHPRDYFGDRYGDLAQPFDLPLVPRDEWVDRIREMHAQKTRLSDIVGERKRVLNQQQTNYCWGFATVGTLETVRIKQNEPDVAISPASVCAPIKDYANEGGWGSQALRSLIDRGGVPTSLWPDTGIDRQYQTAEAEQARQYYRVIGTEWTDIRPRDFDQLMTVLLNRLSASVGLNWWRHQIEAVDPVYDEATRQFGFEFWNSWGISWGQNGRGRLLGSKAIPDDAIAARAATPT